MALRTLVVSGFEPSGHDSVAAALMETAPEATEASLFLWREVVPEVADEPIFRVHRELSARADVPHPSVLGSAALHDALADDLGSLLPIDGVDLLVSTHPYSTAIARREATRRRRRDLRIVDVHTDYSRFPVVGEEDADVFCGRFPRRIRGVDSTRLRVTGIPVSASVVAAASEPPSGLLVLGGTSGWALEQAISRLRGVADWCGDGGPVGVSANAPLAAELGRAAGLDVRAERPGQPYAALFRRYRYVMTKASGPPVAYAHATGTVPVLYRTGVAWEDEAAVELVAANLAAPAWFPPRLLEKVLPEDFCSGLASEQRLAARAAKAVWSVALGQEDAPPAAEVPEQLVLAARGGLLPRTASVIASTLRGRAPGGKP